MKIIPLIRHYIIIAVIIATILLIGDIIIFNKLDLLDTVNDSTNINSIIEQVSQYNTINLWFNVIMIAALVLTGFLALRKVLSQLNEASNELSSSKDSYNKLKNKASKIYAQNKGASKLLAEKEHELIEQKSLFENLLQENEAKEPLERAAAIRKKLVNISLDGIVMIHGERFVEANNSFLSFFGFEQESELIGKTSFDISPEFQPDGMTSVEKLNGIFGQVIEKGTQEFDWQLQRPDGTTFDTLINGSFIEMKEDQPLTQFTIKDISERKQQEEILKQSTEKANAMSKRMREIALEQTKAAEMRQKLFEISNDGILMLHGEEFTEANQAYLDFFGFDNIKGKLITDVSAPIQQDGTPVMEKAVERIEEAIKNRTNEFEWLHQRPDGSQFIGLVNMIFVEELDGKPLLQLTIKDITLEKEAKEALEKAASIRKKLVDISLDGIVTIHGEQFTEANKSFLKFFGFKKESQLLGKTSFDISPEFQPDGTTSVEKLNGIFEQVIKKGAQEFEWQLQRPDGSTFDTLINGSFIEMKDDQPLTQFTIKDISERKQQEESLREASEKANAMSKKMRDIALEQTKAIEMRKKLLDISNDGILLAHGGVFLETNRAGLEIYGVKDPSDFIGKTPADFSPEFQPDGQLSSAAAMAEINKTIENGTNNFEWVHTKLDGTEFDALISGAFIEMRDEKPLMEFTVKDITIEKRANESLRQAAELRQKLFEISNDGILILHGEEFTDANQSYLDFFGFDSIEGKFITDVSAPIQPDGTPAMEKAVERIKYTIENRTNEFEWLHQRPDGSQFLGLVNMIFIEELDGKPLFQLTIKDITVEKQAQEELERAVAIRHKLESISLDGIVMIHGEQFVETNQSFLNLFGFKGDSELLGKTSFDISPEFQPDGTTSVEKLNGIFGQVIEKGTQEFEWVLQRPDGTLIDSLINGSFIEMRDGQPLTQFTIKDVTEQKKQEEALRKANEKSLAMSKKMQKVALEQTKAAEKLILAEKELKKTLDKEREGSSKLLNAMDSLKEAQSQLVNSEKMASLGQLTAGIAHEINNPINFVYNGVETLKESMDEMMTIINKYEDLDNANSNFDDILQEIKDLKDKLDYEFLTEDINQMIDDIKVGAVRTIEIVKGLRVFSRLDEEERKKANVNENLDATLILLRNKTKDKVLVKRFFDEDMSSIFCYPGQLNQVFMNLLNNAVQAFPEDHEKPVIEIFTEDTDSVIKIRIKDNGIGIPEHVKKRIFEPFFTTKDVGVGTGLGLSISYGIIEKHDGTINVNSEVGKGTEFVINLPKLSK